MGRNKTKGLKRKERATSSVSSSDFSFDQSSDMSTPKNPEGKNVETKKQEAKKSKSDQVKVQTTIGAYAMSSAESETVKGQTTITEQLEVISKKLENLVTETTLATYIAKLITKEDLKVAMQCLKGEIREEVNNTVKEKFDELNGKNHELAVTNDKLREDIKHLNEKCTKQSFEITAAMNAGRQANSKVNDLEQHTRKSSIRIFGMNDGNKDETITETSCVVTKLLNEKLGMQVEAEDIDIAHRLGRYQPGKPRPIIAKFMTRRHKIETIQKRRALKGTRIVIREDLTPFNQSLLKEVNDLGSVHSAWSHDGKIFAKLFENGNIIRINAWNDLAKL
jgi:hypothetical protein